MTELNKSTLLCQYQNLTIGMLRKLGLSLLGAAALAHGYQTYTESYIFTRNLRTIRCGLHILYGYKIAFNEDNYLDIHESIAKDIYETCIENDGLYVKFGQGIATMDHILPPPFYKHLSKLQDQAKAASYDKISAVFEEDIGKPISQIFLQFEQKPIASASLAQVHRAKLKDGRSVAVKIQKPNIKKQFASDMMMHYLINWVLQTAFDLPLLRFVDDIQANLKKELDFRIQTDNAIRGRRNFQQLKRSQLYVPDIMQEYSRERVMVSEWIDGFKITDTDKMQENKFDKKTIMNQLIRAFAQQVFVSGFIHCDPHPGNVLVRPHPQNPKSHQLVILDFGLCLSISEKFRLEYANFWKHMFSNNTDGMKEICLSWGMKYNDAFAGWQLLRPFNPNKRLTKKVEKKDVIKMQLEMKGKIKEMMNDTINFPKELIFIGRNMNLVRSLNKHYGGIADRIPITAKAAYYGTTITHSQNARKSVSYYWQSLRFNVSIWIMELIDWFLEVFSGRSLETYIEDETLKNTEKMFKQYGFKPISQETYKG